jgi:hypothetical protein
MMSIKSTEIKEAYKKARHAYTEQRRYWRNRGVELPPLPKIPKKITEASIRKIKYISQKAGERAHAKTKKTGKTKNAAPAIDILDAIYKRLSDTISRCASRIGQGATFAREADYQKSKLDAISDLIDAYAVRKSVSQARMIQKNLKEIDLLIDRLIFDRYESMEARTGCSTGAWDRLVFLIGGVDMDTGEILY